MIQPADILIVDDNPINLQVLSGILEDGGYKVRAALSGEVALRAASRERPDLVLLDIRMPGMSGFDVCQRLKAGKDTQDIPVIFISAMQNVEDKLAAFQCGGVDYVAKPFQAEEVLVRVKTHVELSRMRRDLERIVGERTRDLEWSEARYRVLFEDNPLAVIVYDADEWVVLEVNAATTRMLGYPKEAWIGKTLEFAIGESGQGSMRSLARNITEHCDEAVFTGSLQLRHREGYLVETEGIVRRVAYPGRRAHILMLQDISERRKVEEKLRLETSEHRQKLELSLHYDALTGLPNRALFAERAREGIRQSKLTGRWMAVCYLDLDAFSEVNEAYGQETCDHLLINTAECLRSCLRGGDTLARMGGDEFALLVLGIDSKGEMEAFLGDLVERLAEPFVSDTAVIPLTASVGVTIYPLDGADADTLLRHAEQAMIRAKQVGRGRYQFFDPESDRRVRAQQETIDLMRTALKAGEFVLYYQPKVDVLEGKVVGAEALIRWQHPERGLLPPGAFLPAIEDDPFVAEIGDWVIGEALEQMVCWRQAGLDIDVSVNIAAQHLLQPSFVDRLRTLLMRNPGMRFGSLEVEVLETSRLDDIVKVEEIIVACRALGVAFSLDDFGTGYSSLSCLRGLSADTLKIDQSFVRNMLTSSGDLAIVSGVVGLAGAFGRKVVAEGVETMEHARLLVSLGCYRFQGFGIARPMPAEDVPGWVESWPDASWGWLGERGA